MIDLEELKKKAQAATPGKWSIVEDNKDLENRIGIDGGHGRYSGGIVSESGAVVIIADPSDGEYFEAIDIKSANAAFIAAANPQAILALIEKIESLEAILIERGEWDE